MTLPWRCWVWPVLKVLLAVALLGIVGWQFQRDLARLDLGALQPRPGWLAAAGALYLAGLGMSAGFWYRLLRRCGERPTLRAVLRAYYIGHLGKYVPGKAWALLLRGGLVHGPRVRLGVALLTAFYEVLTTMAAGALVAAVIFLVDPPEVAGLPWPPALTGLLLLGVCVLPLLPGVFNYLVTRAARRFPNVDSLQLPPVGIGTLALGLTMTATGWGLFGLSAWSLLQGILPEPPALTLSTWARLAGSIGLAYVAGFLTLVLPGGFGVREFFLLAFWSFLDLPEPFVAAAVLLLRLVWTASEACAALVMLPLGRKVDAP